MALQFTENRQRNVGLSVSTNPRTVLSTIGAQGPQGDQGIQGVAGAAATITVGTVDTVAAGNPATVTNVGSSSAAIFDFDIPQGTQGAQGVPGGPLAEATTATSQSQAPVWSGISTRAWLALRSLPIQPSRLAATQAPI